MKIYIYIYGFLNLYIRINICYILLATCGQVASGFCFHRSHVNSLVLSFHFCIVLVLFVCHLYNIFYNVTNKFKGNYNFSKLTLYKRQQQQQTISEPSKGITYDPLKLT